MATPSDHDRELQNLEAELRRLEVEYLMFFSGRLPRPPWETRQRVETLVKKIDRLPLESVATRFRFSTLQSRFTSLTDLWDRGMRAREEGRAGGPFPTARAPARGLDLEDEAMPDRVVQVVAFRDPVREVDKLRDLYDGLNDARRESGEDAVPFHRFADLVRDQVERLKSDRGEEVAFRVALKDGRVMLTARALKGRKA